MQTDAFTRKIFYRLDPGRLFSATDHLFIYLFIYSFIHLFIYLFIYLTILSLKKSHRLTASTQNVFR